MNTSLRTALAHREDLAWLDAQGVERQLDQAVTRWPSLGVSHDALVRRLVDVIERCTPAPESLEALRPAEQVLVVACLQERPGAIEALEATAFGGLRAVARRFKGLMTEAELTQRVRTKLLVPHERTEPQLATFMGATSLARWVRVVAVRVGLDAARADGRRGARERALPSALPQRDPEFYWMRQLYTDDFERVLGACLDALSSRDRNLLRAQVTHGMTLDDMARMWGVHRATIARWLRATRLELVAAVRTGLRAETGLSESEVDSVIALIHSAVSEGVIARGLAKTS